MKQEQAMIETEFCARVSISIEPTADSISEQELNRIALEAFKKWFSEHENLHFTILEGPRVVIPDEYVTLVFCERHELSETSLSAAPELQKQFFRNCLRKLPVEWQASYVGTRVNGELIRTYPL